ncbi:hypothetical protein [Flavobacterium chungangense]|uniref:hypothetical protein n=1 Tax=Flavobacterium chungangense TaxID=554283 RepID=UPI0004DF5637|nr:hypothetical protein [Flavobacterium chungangense]
MAINYSRIKQIVKVLLACFFIISCNGQVKNKKKHVIKEDKKQIENINSEQPPVNFFDQKYFSGYMISFGDEDIAEHPYRYYCNYENKEVQWFAISYVPKDISLQNYWLNYIHGSNIDEIQQSSVIEKLVNKDLTSYNIFAVYIPKKYLDISNGESEDAIFFKNNTEVYFYLYDLSEKKWKFLSKVKTNSPFIGKRDFFYKQFPELFSFDKVLKLNENRKIAYSYDYDLDQDGIKDKIILYTNDEEKGEFERIHFGLPMEIKKGLPDKTYQTWCNNNSIIRKNNFNCAAEGFSTIVSKNNYFTIESQICSDYIEISSYLTFKVIGKNILLYKYSQTYFDKADHDRIIPQRTWGVKDFHNVNFEDVTDDFLIKLIQVKPKK